MPKLLMDWFTKNFDIEVIYLIRHPIPTALSILNRKWGNTAKTFLENEYFQKNFLDKKK